MNGSKSDWSNVTSGVPQGTVLGPLLFIIYMNDLPTSLTSHIRLFADDALIYRTIKSESDTNLLQKDLDKLQLWEEKWSMKFNIEKCKSLTITNKLKPLKIPYFLHKKELESVESAKYLGVLLQKKLLWKKHVDSICYKANGTRFFLQRNLYKCNKKVKEKAFNTYVLPIINYASTVWNPVGNQSLRHKLEMVQRSGARFVFNKFDRNNSPTEMIKKLGWVTPEKQRAVSNLIMVHKIVHQNIAIPIDILPKRSRSSNIQFQPMYGRVQAFSNSFVPFTISLWNKLPVEIVNEVSQACFKEKVIKSLDKILS